MRFEKVMSPARIRQQAASPNRSAAAGVILEVVAAISQDLN
jgi:hypothetical protein